MLRALRSLALAVSLVGLGCSAPAEGDDDATTDLGSALASGTASVDDALILPSARVEVGSWVAYTLAPTAAKGRRVLFVNHAEDAASLAVVVDPSGGDVELLAAPRDGTGPALLDALVDDVAGLEASPAPGPAGSVAPRGLGDAAAKPVAVLLAKAAARLRVSVDVLATAIRDYSSWDYALINEFLREGISPGAWRTETGSKARTLWQAVRSLPPTPAESHRWANIGFRFDHFLPDRVDAFLRALRTGTYRDRGFLSTTLNDIDETTSMSTVRFDIQGRSGRDISAFSNLPHEREILFMPGTRFQVTSARGEFVTNHTISVSTDDWWAFVSATSEYFPGVTRADIEAQRRAGRVPNLVVTLVER